MLRTFFGYDSLDSFYFRQPWPAGVMVLLIVAALAVAVLLYRKEPALSRRKRIVLGSLRALLLIAILLLLFEPVGAQTRRVRVPSNVLVLIDVSESMAFADERKTTDELEDVARALGKSRNEVSTKVARIELARGILQHPELKVLRDPGPKHRLRFFAFGDRLEAAPKDAEGIKNWQLNLKAAAPSTRLGDALQQAVERYTGQPLAAVIVLTDGASNDGIDPLEAARQLQVPIHTIGLGLPKPDDVRLATVTAPEAVFPKEKVPLRVQLDATAGFVGREVTLTIKADGREAASKSVKLIGAGQFEELTFVPEPIAAGAANLQKLEIAVSPLPGEATAENNQLTRTVKIIDEKIKVLYVEGRPRWEFRYLRAVLQRDPRMVVKFLMTEGDPDLARATPDQYIERFPEDEASTFKHDLVILGDVPSGYFTPKQLEWLEKLVRENGGSFLMLGGERHAPMSYVDTPLARLLPVKLGAGGREAVDTAAHPFVTPAGKQSKIMELEAAEADNQQAWAQVRPLFNVPRLEGPKPGAIVLATLSDRANRAEPYPLIAWQRYGSGKSMFVGTDKLWRLRFKRGDEHHARFWGQAAQFLTLSRLLGENKRVRIETDGKNFRTGQRVMIQATVLDSEYLPVKADSYRVLIESVPARGEPRAVVLRSVPAAEGLFQGYFTADQPGTFQVVAQIEDENFASKADFQVESISREKLEPAMQKELLQKLSELSGGKILTLRELPMLNGLLRDQSRMVALPPQETELWNNWLVFACILGLAGTEWFLRRRNDVA